MIENINLEIITLKHEKENKVMNNNGPHFHPLLVYLQPNTNNEGALHLILQPL